jgi:hypothetical protein
MKTFHKAFLPSWAFIAIMGLLVLQSGCVHLQSLSQTSIPAERSKMVRAEAHRFYFLFLNFNNDYVNDMVEQLANQCPKGQVKGVLTKHEGITYFPIIAHATRVEARGYCVAGQ